ncbi:MAG TPA: ABC transporter ATP-binding protein [Phototrophicaceae bacterium]|nr:ABC transporter ATP-binding protein [Phototrophicaceae bacterium]
MSESLLRVEKLSAGYGAMTVLSEITFEITRGEIVALVGSNGAGKTTTLRALSRVISSQGGIFFNGRDLARLTSDQVFSLGLVQVPEGRQLFDHMTVEDNLLMGAYCRKKSEEVAFDLQQVYQFFPILEERRFQMAGSLSGGEQQMCAIARGLMARPQLLMIDEMSLGLAPIIVDLLIDKLAEVRKNGVTVLLVEQDIFSAFHVADRGYVLETGKIVRTGRASELAEDPEVRRAYLGI